MHHELPMLTIMHNNRGYHMELMYLQYIAGVRGRGTERMHIGTTFRDPHIDYASIAKGYGMNSEGRSAIRTNCMRRSNAASRRFSMVSRT